MKKLRHVVLLGFNSGTPQPRIDEIVQAFVDLKDKIPVIKDFEWGTDISPEGLQNNHTHSFLLTFHSTADRDTYLAHPDHVAFADSIGDAVKCVTVIDYWQNTVN